MADESPTDIEFYLRLLQQENFTYSFGNNNFFSNNSVSDTNERKFDRNTQITLVMMYCILITIGVVGNSLVCIAVIRKPQMRTARNVFIVNLAISDLTLCLFTMPFSLVEIIVDQWPLGEFLCRVIPAIQATTIFVSTISITAIALDRYQVIVYPTKESMKKVGSVVILCSIWTISFLMATPLFIFRSLTVIDIKDILSFELNLSSSELLSMQRKFCMEDWPITHGRAIYSLAAMMFQYVLPIVVVSAAYARICIKLRYRMINQVTSPHQQRKKEIEEKRQRKTNMLLIAIAMVFAVSWLPLNFLNILGDFRTDLFPDVKNFFLIFACCHMLGMSSACSNPLLYGWLNEKFRREFNEIFKVCFGKCDCKCPHKNRKGQEPVTVVMYTKANCNHVSETQDGSSIITQTVTTTMIK